MSGAIWMSLGYGWTYAMTPERFAVEGLIGAIVPMICVFMGALAAVVMANAKED